jgi:hypothetical protein
MHFDDLRGKNGRQHDPGALFVGANNLPIAAVEAMARAFLADDPTPFVSMGSSTRTGGQLEALGAPMALPRHPDAPDARWHPVTRRGAGAPDPRVQAVLEMTREDELMQAVDRLRSIR